MIWTMTGALRLALGAALLAACGDNLAPPAPADCTGQGPPPTGLTLDAAREAHRRAALRQRLRHREALDPGYLVRTTAPLVEQARIERGQVCPQDLAEVGRLLFEHTFTFADGLAAGAPPADAPLTSVFRRIQAGRAGGPETTGCTSCHWRNGPAGGGGVADASFILGDGDSVASADARNPPSLLGAGVAQALAEEMSAALAALREAGRAEAKRTGRTVDVELVTQDVSFGVLRIAPDGRLDTEDVRGIDADLIVRPFGWKGTAATIVEFIAEAAAVHLGIQAEGLAAHAARDPLALGAGPVEDPDEDGIADELTAGQLTALAAYVAALELPIGAPHQRPVELADPAGPTAPYLVDEWARGRQLLEDLGCASCHVPRMVLTRSTVTLRTGAGPGITLDLARDAEAPRLGYDAAAGGYPVYVFSDFKRHDLGEANASVHRQQGIATRLYLTRRLWGVGDSAPYFYDGGAPTIDAAIARHGGEAAFARTAWTEASAQDRSALRVFLTALRRAPRLTVP